MRMLLVLMISLTTLTFTASQQDFVTFRVTLDEDTTMLISPSPDDQERLSGAADGAGLPNEMSPLTSDKHEGASLLWLPYVALTLFLISLLLASFIHFHIKYRDRYVQRDKLRKEIARPAEPDDIEAAAAAATAAAGAAMFNHLPLSATRLLANRAGLSGSNNMPEESALPRQKTRLKMLYDNKVDVSSIVENSLLGRRGSAGDIPQSTSDDVTSDHLVPFNDADHDRYTYRLNGNSAAQTSSQKHSSTGMKILNVTSEDEPKKKNKTSVSLLSSKFSKSKSSSFT